MHIVLVNPRASYYNRGGEILPFKQGIAFAEMGHNITFMTTKVDLCTPFYSRMKQEHPEINYIEIEPTLAHMAILKQLNEKPTRELWERESLSFSRLSYSIKDTLPTDLIITYYILDGILHPPSRNVLYLLGYAEEYVPLYSALLAQYDDILAISNNTSQRWMGQYDQVQDINPVLPGVDILPIAGTPFVETEKYSAAYPKIVFAGKFIERKGVRNLLGAMPQILTAFPKARLYLLGDGPEEGWINDFIVAHHLEDAVELCGYRYDSQNYFAYADLCIFPSLYKEGLMGVVMESLLSGGLVLTTPNNGNEEVIEHGVNGYIFDMSSSDKITTSISHVMESSESERNIMRKNAITKTQRYTWRNQSAEFLAKLNVS